MSYPLIDNEEPDSTNKILGKQKPLPIPIPKSVYVKEYVDSFFIKKILIGLLLFILPITFYNTKAEAKTQQEEIDRDLEISEFNPWGSQMSNSDEWIELYNPTSKIINLEKYRLVIDNKIFIYFKGTKKYGVSPSEHFLISNFDYGAKSSLNIKPDFISSKIDLNNTNTSLKLEKEVNFTEYIAVDEVADLDLGALKKDIPKGSFSSIEATRLEGNSSWQLSTESRNLNTLAQNGTPENSGFEPIDTSKIDIKIVNSKLPIRADLNTDLEYKIETKYAYSILDQAISTYSEKCGTKINPVRAPDLPGTYCTELALDMEISGLQFQITKSKNIIYENEPQVLPTITKSFTGLVISEINPYAPEYIELHNSSDKDIDLTDLHFQDLKKDKYFIKNKIIKAGEYLAIKDQKNINLNDNGDSVMLYFNNTLLQEIVYSENKNKNLSYQLHNNNWFWAEKTPDKPNKQKPTTITNKTTLKKSTSKKADTCTTATFFGRSTKKTLITSLGKVRITESFEEITDKPRTIKLCGFRDNEVIDTTKSAIIGGESDTQKIQISDETELEEIQNQFVDFNLSCVGLKNPRLSVQDIGIKKTIDLSKDLDCKKGHISGSGYIMEGDERPILFVLSTADISKEQTQNLEIQSNQTQFSNIMEYFKSKMQSMLFYVTNSLKNSQTSSQT
jgi:hypothetical protein